MPGARVDIWHCDAEGNYSGHASQGSDGIPDTSSETFLRGTQFADDQGVVTFRTIYPGWYRGRTMHKRRRHRSLSKTTDLPRFAYGHLRGREPPDDLDGAGGGGVQRPVRSSMALSSWVSPTGRRSGGGDAPRCDCHGGPLRTGATRSATMEKKGSREGLRSCSK